MILPMFRAQCSASQLAARDSAFVAYPVILGRTGCRSRILGYLATEFPAKSRPPNLTIWVAQESTPYSPRSSSFCAFDVSS